MKKIYSFLFIGVMSGFIAKAQNAGINATGAAPNNSAMLDIAATDKGLLIPRVALVATNSVTPITSPAASLLVYNTATAGTGTAAVVPGYYYWSGTVWTRLVGASAAWQLSGNTGTIPGTDFLGTTDAQDLVLKTNNAEKVRITSTGNVGIGIAAPTVLLDVIGTGLFRNGNTSASFTNNQLLFGYAGNNQYQHAIKTRHNTTGQAGNAIDFYVWKQGADAIGTVGTQHVMTLDGNGYVGIGGITAPHADLQFSNAVVNRKIVLWEGGNNDHQFYGLGINASVLRYQTAGTGADHVFFAAASATASNELMRIKGTGNVGIGTAAPGAKLEVAGQVKITGGAPGATKVLTSDATGLTTWQYPTEPKNIAQPANLVGGVIPNGFDGYMDGNGNYTATVTLPAAGSFIGQLFIFGHGATFNTTIATTNTDLPAALVLTGGSGVTGYNGRGAVFMWTGNKWAFLGGG